MREIKFRALFELQEGGTEWRTTKINEFHGDRGDKQISPWLQFTGLTDKNGVDVYEGDVVVCRDVLRQVKFSEQNASFYLSHTVTGKTYYKEFVECAQSQSDGAIRLDNITVIGNIHQHPNLLTK